MRKIGICGNLNLNVEELGGQTIKTYIIYHEFLKMFNQEDVMVINTSNWKKKPLSLLVGCVRLSVHCKNIFIFPAHNGMKIFVPLFFILTKLFNRKLHYIVIGAWLPDELRKNHIVLSICKKIDFIHVETNTLKSNLEKIGISKNVVVTPNFKSINSIEYKKLRMDYKQPYKMCTFSRVNYQKGIENLIKVISRINKRNKKNIILLDVYGPIEKDYEEKFLAILEQNSAFVTYKGCVKYDQSVEVIKEYFLLLFPTRYYTEGIPGTIIDAYLAGVPVLASRWESCYDVIKEGVTGITYEFNNDDNLLSKLNYCINNTTKVVEMKKHCLKEAQKYTADHVMNELKNTLK